MKDKLVKTLAVAIAVMGVVHIIATFTPLIDEGLENLTQAKHNAMTYMSLMCGTLLIVCGLLVFTFHSIVMEHSFLKTPYRIIVLALTANAITAVAYMPHNPFAWIVFVLIASLVGLALFCNKN